MIKTVKLTDADLNILEEALIGYFMDIREDAVLTEFNGPPEEATARVLAKIYRAKGLYDRSQVSVLASLRAGKADWISQQDHGHPFTSEEIAELQKLVVQPHNDKREK